MPSARRFRLAWIRTYTLYEGAILIATGNSETVVGFLSFHYLSAAKRIRCWAFLRHGKDTKTTIGYVVDEETIREWLPQLQRMVICSRTIVVLKELYQ